MKVLNLEKILFFLVLMGQFLFQGVYISGLDFAPAYVLVLILSAFVLIAKKAFHSVGNMNFNGFGIVFALLFLNILFVCFINDVMDPGRLMLILFSFLFFWSCKENAQSEKDIRFLYYSYIFIMIISSLVAIGQAMNIEFCITWWQNTHADDKIVDALTELRVVGMAADVLAFGYQVSTAFIITLFFDFKKFRIFKIPLLLLFGYALIVNETRSAWIAAILGVVIYLLNMPNVKSKVLRDYARFLGVLIIVFALLFFTMSEFNVFEGTRMGNVDSATTARTAMILTAFNHALHYPLGMGAYSVQGELVVEASSSEYAYVVKNTAHNFLGNCAASYGFIGLALMLLIYYKTYKSYRIISKNIEKHSDYLVAFVCILGLAINAFFHNNYMLNGELSTLMFIGVLAAGLSKATEKNKEEK